MHNFLEIQALQIEISNHCNASCPQCPRNFFGGKVIPTLPLKSWTLKNFKDVVDKNLLTQLSNIYFCGTYGDPCTNNALVSIAEYVKSQNPLIQIGLHTNGGVNTSAFFQRLAKTVDFIAFGIDGLEDTNHVYRRGVSWARLIKNACSFIEAGGIAYWDFIVFKHNQHQVNKARELSQNLGFIKFSIKRTGRFLGYDHVERDTVPVYNRKGKIDYEIALPTNKEYLNDNYQTINEISQSNTLENYAQTTKINCNSKRIREIYIGADGFVFPCGWLHDRMYGPNIINHSDHTRILNLMTQAGGLLQTNVFYNSLENIVNGPWFKTIEQSWGNNQRLSRCGIMCGESINLIGNQNIEIVYKK